MRLTGVEQTPAQESFCWIWVGLDIVKRAAIALVTCVVAALFALRAKIRYRLGRKVTKRICEDANTVRMFFAKKGLTNSKKVL